MARGSESLGAGPEGVPRGSQPRTGRPGQNRDGTQLREVIPHGHPKRQAREGAHLLQNGGVYPTPHSRVFPSVPLRRKRRQAVPLAAETAAGVGGPLRMGV